uniref:Uncharacterized protein n=1 Tax=Timema shepardi TaxID=629360 RepID=A0A7R9ATP6_TIMSH|nr:unnamed protein product [Timema shepardi]
MGLNSVRF